VTSVSFDSINEGALISTSLDGTVRVWSLEHCDQEAANRIKSIHDVMLRQRNEMEQLNATISSTAEEAEADVEAKWASQVTMHVEVVEKTSAKRSDAEAEWSSMCGQPYNADVEVDSVLDAVTAKRSSELGEQVDRETVLDELLTIRDKIEDLDTKKSDWSQKLSVVRDKCQAEKEEKMAQSTKSLEMDLSLLTDQLRWSQCELRDAQASSLPGILRSPEGQAITSGVYSTTANKSRLAIGLEGGQVVLYDLCPPDEVFAGAFGAKIDEETVKIEQTTDDVAEDADQTEQPAEEEAAPTAADEAEQVAEEDEDDDDGEKKPKHRVIGTVDAHKGQPISALSFGPSSGGTLSLLTGAESGSSSLWDVAVWGYQAECHATNVSALAVSQDGKHIASGSTDGQVRLWNNTSAHNESCFSCDSAIYGLEFVAQNGRKLAVALANGSFRIWCASTERFESECQIDSLACISCASNWISVACGKSTGEIVLWHTELKSEWANLEPPAGKKAAVSAVKWTKDCSQVVSSSQSQLMLWDSGSLCMLDCKSVDAGICRAAPRDQPKPHISSMSLSGNGKVVAACAGSDTAIYDVRPNELIW